MTATPIDPGAHLRLASKVILAAGLLAAVVIYATAARPADNPLGDPEDSKVYLRQMQLYGGEANVIGYEIRQWVDSLWHGRRLAFTVAVLAALVAGGCRFAAIPLPPADGSDEEAVEGSPGGQDGRGQDGSGQGG